jgi:hypothetical protein
VTQPAVDAAESGEAVDAVRTLQAELRSDYTEIRSAEIQLAEAILSAHAMTVSGRERLHDIQRQLIEAINSPAAALSTPAGERQFLMFLRSKIGEIADIVETGALTDEDHARLTQALGSGYLLPGSGPDTPPPVAPTGSAPAADQAAGMLPALGSALGAVPQAAQGAAAPAQGASGLTGAATPLAGLASGLDEGRDEPDSTDIERRERDETDEPDDDADEAEDRPSNDDADTDDQELGTTPRKQDPPEAPPAPTRPAVLI